MRSSTLWECAALAAPFPPAAAERPRSPSGRAGLWPHAPSKVVTHPGACIATAGTVGKEPLFGTPEKRDLLERTILSCAEEFGWELQAWAVFTNHYHLVGLSPQEEAAVRRLTSKVHGCSARELNRMDGTPGRKVWYRCWDTRITFEKSCLARLAYVHTNAVRHSLAATPAAYPWRSAAWLLGRGDPSYAATVLGLKTDRVNVEDDF